MTAIPTVDWTPEFDEGQCDWWHRDNAEVLHHSDLWEHFEYELGGNKEEIETALEEDETFEVCGYNVAEVNDIYMPDLLQDIANSLGDEYIHPDVETLEDSFNDFEELRAAERVFLDLVKSKFKVSTCEVTLRLRVNFRQWWATLSTTEKESLLG